jgi:hypothetical protein
MSKVQHFTLNKVIRRTDFGPIVLMLKTIAERNGFQFKRNLDWIAERGTATKITPIHDAITELDKANQNVIISEFQWLNMIAFTPQISTTILKAFDDLGLTEKEIVRSASLSDLGAWAYSYLSVQQWRDICTLAQVKQIGRNAWTTAKIRGLPDDIVPDTSEEMQVKIKEAICRTMYNREGRGERGYCSYHFDLARKEDCYRIAMTDHPALKTIWVKNSRFRQRPFRDVFEVVFRYNRKTHELYVCSDSDSGADISMCEQFCATEFAEVKDAEVVIPDRNVYHLNFIKERSGHLPVKAGSCIKRASVILARSQHTFNRKKWIMIHGDEKEDIHASLIKTWRANDTDPANVSVKRLEMEFVYEEPTGRVSSLRCYFTQSTTDFLSSPIEAQGEIREILVSAGLIDAAA